MFLKWHPYNLKVSLLLFGLGVCCLQWISVLPPIHWMWVSLCFLPLVKYPKLGILVWLILGFNWSWWWADSRLAQVLPEVMIKQNVMVTGKVSNLVEQRDNSIRFLFEIQEITFNQTLYQPNITARVSWYYPEEIVRAGQIWQFKMRLKPAHGLVNPAGFDYESWLFKKNIRATGYVKGKGEYQLIDYQWNLSRIREHIKAQLLKVLPDSPHSAIVLALILGDKSAITREQWDVFTRTGTNHLVAISGLHISIVAGLFAFFGAKFWSLLGIYRFFLAKQKVATIFALVGALLYAALAGFSLPTQRALIMLVALSLLYLNNKSSCTSDNLAIAMFFVLIWDPFALMNVGFWLSFGAVAAILWGLSAWSIKSGWIGVIKTWVSVQWSVSLGLIPILLISGLVVSLLSPLINFISVPSFSLLVVPIVLLSALLSFISLDASILIFSLLDGILNAWYQSLSFLAYLGNGTIIDQYFSIPSLVSLSIGLILWLSPKALPGRQLSVVFLLPVFFYAPASLNHDELWVDVLDVGQGLAVIVRTRNHLLVFDSGNKYSSGFSMGSVVITPYLRSLSISKIDKLVLSNGDRDHQGGAEALFPKFEILSVQSGQPERIKYTQAEYCKAGQTWTWDQVNFTYLHPNDQHHWQGNNTSCVLLIEHAKARILLTADIEKPVEKWLLNSQAERLKVDIVVAPHHGSASSSSIQFVEKIQAKYVVFPAGYQNRYHFPRQEVVERWLNTGATTYITGLQGAIRFHISTQGIEKPWVERESQKRYWTK